MKMCESFARIGYQVTLVARKATIKIPENEVFAFYDVDPLFSIRYTTKRLPDAYGVIHTVRSTLFALRSNSSILYGRHIPSCMLSGAIIKNVGLELHEAHAIGGWLSRRIFRMAIRKHWIRPVVVISNALRKDVEEIVSDDALIISVAHDGTALVDSKERMEQVKHGSRERISVAYVGHLYRGKGMEIIPALAKSLPTVDFHVVGGDQSAVEAAKLETRWLPNLFVHGFVPPAEARRFIQCCDIAIAPYQATVMVAGLGRDVSKWMSPLKIFEYMGAGKAIVCSDLPVIREILRNEETALLVCSDDIGEWVRAVRRLASDRDLRHRLGVAAKSEAGKYSWAARAKKIIGLLDGNLCP